MTTKYDQGSIQRSNKCPRSADQTKMSAGAAFPSQQILSTDTMLAHSRLAPPSDAKIPRGPCRRVVRRHATTHAECCTVDGACRHVVKKTRCHPRQVLYRRWNLHMKQPR